MAFRLHTPDNDDKGTLRSHLDNNEEILVWYVADTRNIRLDDTLGARFACQLKSLPLQVHTLRYQFATAQHAHVDA